MQLGQAYLMPLRYYVKLERISLLEICVMGLITCITITVANSCWQLKSVTAQLGGRIGANIVSNSSSVGTSPTTTGLNNTTGNSFSNRETLSSVSLPSSQSNNTTNIISSNLLTYESRTYGIRMQYPSDWQKIENLSSYDEGTSSNLKPIVIFLLQSPVGSSDTFPYQAAVGVTVGNFSASQNMTLKKYADKVINSLRESPLNGVIQFTPAILAGSPGYKIVDTDGAGFSSMTVFTVKDDKIYVIGYVAEAGGDRYSSHLPIVQKMIDSFKLIPPQQFVIHSEGDLNNTAGGGF